jgi:hypothetical protein
VPLDLSSHRRRRAVRRRSPWRSVGLEIADSYRYTPYRKRASDRGVRAPVTESTPPACGVRAPNLSPRSGEPKDVHAESDPSQPIVRCRGGSFATAGLVLRSSAAHATTYAPESADNGDYCVDRRGVTDGSSPSAATRLHRRQRDGGSDCSFRRRFRHSPLRISRGSGRCWIG